jgi:alkylhydroperoxidase family enzyme
MRDALAPMRPPAGAAAPPEGRPKGLNVLGTFAHHPALAKAFLTFNAHILSESTLTPRQRELAVLRVAALRGSAYEWAQHAVLAGDAGIGPDEVDRVTVGANAAEWSTEERVLLRAVDELIKGADVADDTWAVLGETFDERQVLDLVFTVGAYDVLAMALNVCGTPLDDDLQQGASDA